MVVENSFGNLIAKAYAKILLPNNVPTPEKDALVIAFPAAVVLQWALDFGLQLFMLGVDIDFIYFVCAFHNEAESGISVASQQFAHNLVGV